MGLEVLDGSLDVSHTTLDTHLLGGEVGVHTGTVPVTLHGLGVDGDLDTKVLSNTGEEETGNPKLVTHCDTLARTDLVLPLGGHDLGVGTRDVDSGVETGLVVGLNDVTHNNLASTNTTVVRTLGGRETALGPAERSVIKVEESVLLLETKPRLVLGVSLHHLLALMTEVELVGGAIGVPALGENDDVGGTTEGIRVDGTRAEVDVRVVTRSLVCGGTVKVPDGKVFRLVFLLLQSLS